MKNERIKIRRAKISEIGEIKKLVDSFEEMDVIEETFTKNYYKRILKKGILFIAIKGEKIIGVCFGTYNLSEKWADLLGLVVKEEFRKKGVGNLLIKEFEKIVKTRKLKTIDLYADKFQINLFRRLRYKQGRTYTSFRKKLK